MVKFIITLLLILYGIVVIVVCIMYITKIIIDKKPKNKVHFYVARDKDGVLNLYIGKPFRGNNRFYCSYDKNVFCLTYNLSRFGLKEEDFDFLKWEDEPVEVFLNMED